MYYNFIRLQNGCKDSGFVFSFIQKPILLVIKREL